ncbi:MAG: hypothetical protein GC162_10425 [Planctomycetes bacterium]|nr:hypothetical protein [Planctomycetota bacterium]
MTMTNRELVSRLGAGTASLLLAGGYLQPCLYCFDPTTRLLLWEGETHKASTFALATDGTSVYVAGEPGTAGDAVKRSTPASLFKFNGAGGDLIWSSDPGRIFSMACSGGQLYASIQGPGPGVTYRMVKISGTTGQVLRDYVGTDMQPYPAPSGQKGVNAGDVIAAPNGDLILTGFGGPVLRDGGLLDVFGVGRYTANGHLVWGAFDALPATSSRFGTDGSIYSPGSTSEIATVAVVDPSSGDVIDRANAHTFISSFMQPPIWAAEASGRVIVQFAETGGAMQSDGVGSGPYNVAAVSRIDFDSALPLWRHADAGLVARDFLVIGNEVICAGHDAAAEGIVFAISRFTGAVLWTFKPVGFAPGSFERILKVGTNVVVAGYRGTMY